MPTDDLLGRLKELSEVDAALLRLLSERKKLETQFRSLNDEIEKLKKDVVALQAKAKQSKFNYDLETKKVRDERDKLAARRRALATLGNYKLQQAAAKEIDAAETEVSAHEDTLVALLDGAELAEKSATEKELLLLDKDEERAALVRDMKPTLETLAEREAKYNDTRAALASKVDTRDLATYDGLRSRLAPDVMSPIVSGACDFCNLQTPPQMVIQVTAGTSIQKCRGCSRILYIPSTKD